MPLFERRQRFIDEYLIDRNAAQAAIRAGYSRRGARQAGHRLLTDVDVASPECRDAQDAKRDVLVSS